MVVFLLFLVAVPHSGGTPSGCAYMPLVTSLIDTTHEVSRDSIKWRNQVLPEVPRDQTPTEYRRSVTRRVAFQQAEPTKPVFDQLVLTHGATVEGLLLSETPQELRFQFLMRRPGVRSLIFETTYDRSEVSRIIKAPEPGRTAARQLIEGLETSKKREEASIASLTLSQVPWINGEGKAVRYQGPYFELISTAPEELVRLICVRLNAMFGAYVSTLGKREQPTKPVRIILFPSMAEYRSYQERRGIPLLNPAIYDARTMEIVVGCDLPLRTKELQTLKSKHASDLKELLDQKKKIARHYGGQMPALLAKQLQQLQQQLQSIDAENEGAFAKLQASFFAILYHEAFHAYLDQWVYPTERYQVPRWLNEGLAQLFENAFVEIDELRIGRIDEKRLAAIQDEVRQGRFMTIRELIQSPTQQFMVRHGSDSFEASRHYQASWALAHFLALELKLLTSPAMVKYVTLPVESDEIKRFEQLVGMPLAECEDKWKAYLLRLRTDGTLRP